MVPPSGVRNAQQPGPNGGRGNLVFSWTVATGGGLISTPMLGAILALGLYASGIGDSGGGFGAAIIGMPLGVAAAGIVIGISQATVLAHIATPSGWTRHAGWRWALATAGGWIAGLAGGFIALNPMASLAPDSWDSGSVSLAATLAALAIMGALLGLAQWLVLRTHAAHAGRWVVASAAGTVGGALLISIVLQVLTGYGTPLLGSSIGALILAALGGAVGLGVITGLTLAALLNVPALRPHLST